ncbi:TadE/TadG family type IV pilus assembly protein [Streptomyces sp. NPDC002851]
MRRRSCTVTGGGDRERGSAAVELVVVTPLLVLVLLVVVAFGRLADARLVVADAAHQAARATSLARTENAAHRSAERAAQSALSSAGQSCDRSQVYVSTGGLRPGGTVRVRVSCTADLGDLTRTGMPGQVVVEGTAHSIVDTYRSDTQ